MHLPDQHLQVSLAAVLLILWQPISVHHNPICVYVCFCFVFFFSVFSGQMDELNENIMETCKCVKLLSLLKKCCSGFPPRIQYFFCLSTQIREWEFCTFYLSFSYQTAPCSTAQNNFFQVLSFFSKLYAQGLGGNQRVGLRAHCTHS